MKLIYRGATYDYNPNSTRSGNTGRPVRSNSLRSPYTLIYRGVKVLVDPQAAATEESSLPKRYDLLYRGTAYHVTRDAQGRGTITTEPAGQATARTVAVPSSFPSRQYAGKLHQANILKNLQRRMQVAQARQDHQLIALLEAEQRQISA